ncbi:beta-galactosidase subunit beta [Streptococcus criceti]|uniref:YhcH/YjgK/YiaL family protein n=1 Tax=Streptococcus criceti HS-6 TaxID=873449 RepID=G5JSY6_STRCG|nr:YhcH/YjgK/YiaL family protein [Streptococcus criceti]EHI73724.1 hypothetical protein STRCR_2257 [Streptococcus criceti HS-6]SUN43506.1 beta-galactosidase subunit beta [Streptococcus criceti]
MLYSNIKSFNLADYQVVGKVLQLLQERNFLQVEDGRIQVDEDIYLQVLSYQTQDVSNLPFERHHKRLDVHYVVEGSEYIYLSSLTEIEPATPYDIRRDIEFLEEPEHINKVKLKKGDFLIIGMDEPHKTNGWVDETPEFVKKVVVKVNRNS